jgi:hypothetical protein
VVGADVMSVKLRAVAAIRIGGHTLAACFVSANLHAQSGCEDVAASILEAVGGLIVSINGPIAGATIGNVRDIGDTVLKNPAGELARGWYHHHVVVADGHVFNALTGPAGQTIAEYAARWEYPGFILEALTR